MIPFVDLKAQYLSIKPEIDAAVFAVLESSQFILGKYVEAFEKDFAAYCGATHAMGVNSGTSALHLALLAAGVGAGDEVITTPFTFVATAAAIHYCGARPVYVDIDPASFTIDPARIEEAITARTKAILPVHLYGQPADMDPILAIAKRHNLIVIEDAAQAHGAEYKGRRVGSIGDMGCFSFYPGKNLGAYGEGGAVTTNNDDCAKAIRTLRDWGQSRKYHHDLRGFNYRLEGMQGAILGVKLKHLERWTEARRTNAALYTEYLAGADVATPVEMDYSRHVYHVYAIRTGSREALAQELNAQGVQTGIHYPIPVHLQKAYADSAYKLGDFPHAERAANEVLSLPMFPELTEEQVRQAAGAVAAAAVGV
ncbi:MAG: DegT/DnrJ/EryC1/StrS family aminotransferase [Bryobacteraceae bacterium]